MKMPNAMVRTYRHAFTLVELLVAMALILFIMSIISVAFVDSTESFRIFRARAELSEKLRFLTQTLRSDLRANHFENNRRLSDPDFWEQGPPKAGYFRVEQTNPNMLPATTTMEGDPVISAGPNDKHVLMLSSFLQGQDYTGFHSVSDSSLNTFKGWLNSFSAPDSRLETGNSYNSPDAEIAWFMGGVDTSSMSAVSQYDFAKNASSFDRLEAGDLGVTLYKLYRRTAPMLPCEIPSTTTAPTFDPSTLDRISVIPPGITVDSTKKKLNGITNQLIPNVDVPFRRLFGRFMAANTVAGWKNSGGGPNSGFNSRLSSAGGAASDWAIIADNVLSFSIEVWPEGAINFSSVQAAFGQPVFDTWCGRSVDANSGVNADFATPNASGVPKWRDNADANKVPMALNGPNGLPKRLLAVRITIRLYDLNTKSTWQATVIEYL
jgi:prepilin-type N-terminal cleavage/methylation domain-containing protein